MGFTYAYRTDEDDDDDEDQEKRERSQPRKKPYQHYEQQFAIQHVHFYLSEFIVEPQAYGDMIHRINIATPADVIFLHLNTHGGRLDTGIQLINTMQNSQAKVVTVLEGMAYSLGTLIFLAGDEMVVNDHCMMMFHNFKGGILGKGNELISQLDATVKWFAALAKKIYVPFLTEDEFERMLRGEDLWMHSPEIRKRLDRMIKTIAAKKPLRKKPLRKVDVPLQ
ncbi:MAG: Clp protease ClpP [Candidatus Thorarchaeota archaeon]|nr:MAG: Clp protease ClpP [Candidatus Thorarchaeota archaeon]